MKLKFIFTISIILLWVISNAQTTDSVEVKSSYGSKIGEVQLLMDLDHIDFYKVYFKRNKFPTSYLLLTTKEYWNGQVKKVDTLLTVERAREHLKINESDSVSTLSLITKPHNDSVLFSFNFLGINLKRTYRRMNSDFYSLRDGIMSFDRFRKTPVDKTVPLFVYSMPYQDPNYPDMLFYCALGADGVPPDKWWEKYKVKHYIVVEMKIVTK